MTSRQVDHLTHPARRPAWIAVRAAGNVDWEHGHAISIDPPHLGDQASLADCTGRPVDWRDGSRPDRSASCVASRVTTRVASRGESRGDQFRGPRSNMATDGESVVPGADPPGAATDREISSGEISTGNDHVGSERLFGFTIRRAFSERTVRRRSNENCRAGCRNGRLRLLDRQQPRLRRT
jgi:hypothetical protein